MKDGERQSQELTDSGAVRLAILAGSGRPDEEAAEFVELDPRIEQGYCVIGTPMVWLVNRHQSRRIRVTIRTCWIYQDRPYTEFTDHWVYDRSEIRIGCIFPGPSTTQRFDREIHSAVFTS